MTKADYIMEKIARRGLTKKQRVLVYGGVGGLLTPVHPMLGAAGGAGFALAVNKRLSKASKK